MTYDAFWRKAMGDAYREMPQGALTLIEEAALLPLKVRYLQADQDDRWHAAVAELREDGATVCKPLTLERLEYEATEIWNGRLSPNFSMPPDGWFA